jgi:hypothetical protein
MRRSEPLDMLGYSGGATEDPLEVPVLVETIHEVEFAPGIIAANVNGHLD